MVCRPHRYILSAVAGSYGGSPARMYPVQTVSLYSTMPVYGTREVKSYGGKSADNYKLNKIYAESVKSQSPYNATPKPAQFMLPGYKAEETLPVIVLPSDNRIPDKPNFTIEDKMPEKKNLRRDKLMHLIHEELHSEGYQTYVGEVHVH